MRNVLTKKGTTMITSLRTKYAARTQDRDDRGSVLILAMIFVLVASMAMLALAGWTTTSLNATNAFTSARNSQYAASGAVTVAENSIRYATLLSPTQAQNVATPLGYCWQPANNSNISQLTTDNVTIAVWCTTTENLASSSTRVVDFYACESDLPDSASATDVAAAGALCQQAPLLHARVTYDDYPPGGSTPLSSQCSTWCGQGTTLNLWKWSPTV